MGRWYRPDGQKEYVLLVIDWKGFNVTIRDVPRWAVWRLPQWCHVFTRQLRTCPS